MKKLMFAALAVASCNAFAAAAPEPASKAFSLTVTQKSIQPVGVLMTKKNISANEVAKTWTDAEAAAPEDSWGNKNFFPDAETRATNPGINEETNKNGTVTIFWNQYKPAKNGVNVVAATKVVTSKRNYYYFWYDDEGREYGGMVVYDPVSAKMKELIPGFPKECKYIATLVSDFQPVGEMVTGDGKVWSTFTGYDPYIEEGFCSILAGQGKAAKDNPADKNAPYTFMKSVAGNLASLNGNLGTFKTSYDKKLSQEYQRAIGNNKNPRKEAIAEALLAKKIYLPTED